MKYLLSLLLVALSGCSLNPLVVSLNEDQAFTAKSGTLRREIVWVAVSHAELQEKCRAIVPANTNTFQVYLGCYTDNQRTCTIYTSTHTNHQLFGHEVRHCFHGNFHK